MADGEIVQGDTGTEREALAQGEATQANTAFAEADAQERAAASPTSPDAAPSAGRTGPVPEDPTAPVGVELVEGYDDEPGRYSNEEDQFLFGGSTRPWESITSMRPAGRVQPSRQLSENLPALLDAAQDPDAPEGLRRLVRLLDYHMGR